MDPREKSGFLKCLRIFFIVCNVIIILFGSIFILIFAISPTIMVYDDEGKETQYTNKEGKRLCF